MRQENRRVRSTLEFPSESKLFRHPLGLRRRFAPEQSKDVSLLDGIRNLRGPFSRDLQGFRVEADGLASALEPPDMASHESAIHSRVGDKNVVVDPAFAHDCYRRRRFFERVTKALNTQW